MKVALCFSAASISTYDNQRTGFQLGIPDVACNERTHSENKHGRQESLEHQALTLVHARFQLRDGTTDAILRGKYSHQSRTGDTACNLREGEEDGPERLDGTDEEEGKSDGGVEQSSGDTVEDPSGDETEWQNSTPMSAGLGGRDNNRWMAYSDRPIPTEMNRIVGLDNETIVSVCETVTDSCAVFTQPRPRNTNYSRTCPFSMVLAAERSHSTGLTMVVPMNSPIVAITSCLNCKMKQQVAISATNSSRHEARQAAYAFVQHLGRRSKLS